MWDVHRFIHSMNLAGRCARVGLERLKLEKTEMKMKSILKNFDRIDASSIKDGQLAKRVAKLQSQRKQGGFTLLELLVVVAILAAIAGTATIALQDTDARASAAAHVAMMDEMNKGIRTFRVLNHNALPNNFDSLLSVDDASSISSFALLPNSADGDILAIGDVAAGAMISGAADNMADIGMSHLRYIDAAGNNPPDSTVAADCAPSALPATVGNRGNAVVAGNIFMGAEGNGCGVSVEVTDYDGSGADANVAYWTGTVERVLGPGDYGSAAYSGAAMGGAGNVDGAEAPVLMAVGIGPSSNLFNANELGGMTSVPVYRHVSPTQYNRFIALFEIGTSTWDATGGTWTTVASDQVSFSAIVDGAGDTKEEELGEWDGTRNTI